MLLSDPLKRNKLLLWLAVGWGVVALLTLDIVSIACAVLLLLCTLDGTARHLKPRLYTISITVRSIVAVISILSVILLFLMRGRFTGMLGILCDVMLMPYAITLVIITVSLLTRKYQPWLFTAFCACAGAWYAINSLNRIVYLVSSPTPADILRQLFYILSNALPIIIIAITLRSGCFFPPEMRLRQLMSMRAAGKLDEVSYQEQRAEVIENL